MSHTAYRNPLEHSSCRAVWPSRLSINNLHISTVSTKSISLWCTKDTPLVYLQIQIWSTSVFPEMHKVQVIDFASFSQGLSADKETSVSRKIPADKNLLQKTYFVDTFQSMLKDTEYFATWKQYYNSSIRLCVCIYILRYDILKTLEFGAPIPLKK